MYVNLCKLWIQVEWVEQQKVKIRVKRDFFKDPEWPQQWYLVGLLFYLKNSFKNHKRAIH